MDENPYRAPQTWCYDASQVERDDWSDHAPRGPLHHEFDPSGMMFNKAAQQSRLVVDGLRFVFDAMAWAPDLLRLSPEAHIRGTELCVAIVRYAEEIFEADAIRALSDWGIVSGDDVGRFVHTMLLNGLLQSSNDDRPEDFNQVGSLRQLSEGKRGM